MKGVVTLISAEAIPFGVLIGVVVGCPLGRRSRFWLRFAGVLVALLIPDLVAILAPLGEQVVGMLLLLGFGWGILLIAPSRYVLFYGGGRDPGPGGEDDGGPGPGDDRPSPPSPIGGIPLPDAEPSSTRVREHRPPRRAPRPRRRGGERERLPSRLRSSGCGASRHCF